MANKVKYGLKNVYYAKATIASNGTATYADPVAWPGAVSLSLTPEGDTNTFYADNIGYATFSANAGYTGTLETALVPESFETNILGAVSADGMIVEDAGAATAHFALLFQFEGDVNATKHVLYNCTAKRPNLEGQTTEASVDVKTESIEITAKSIYNSAISKDIVKSKCSTTTETAYTNWFTSVQQPTTVPSGT